MTQESKDLTTHDTEVENIQIAAQEDAGFEKILKFKKGDFFIGDENIPLGTEYVAHVRAWGKCWIKFVDSEMADRKMYRVALGEKPPEREELDDHDQDNWPEGLDGRPADPWVFQYLLPLEDPAARSSSSSLAPSAASAPSPTSVRHMQSEQRKWLIAASRSSSWR
jgi:hypothetical protein